VLVEGLGEARLPVVGSTATKNIHGPSAGFDAAAMALSPGELIGPGGRPAYT